VRYVRGTADADINITGPRKLGAALRVIKGLKGCFVFLAVLCAGSPPREYGGRNVSANTFLPFFVFSAVQVLGGLPRAMFNIQDNKEKVV